MSDGETLKELRKISKILILTNAKAIESELGRMATTPDRKKMWMLIDGKRTSKQIADAINISQRGVQKFLKEAKLAELIDYEGDSVRRVLDYVPPSWIELLPNEEKENGNVSPPARPSVTLDEMGASESKGEGK